MTTVHKDKKVYQGSAGSLNGGREIDSYTATTTDATPKTVYAVPLAAGEMAGVKAFANGKKADLSAAAGANLTGWFRRAAAGNVTLVGVLQGAVQEDSAGSPSVTLSANTTTQTVDVVVTGIAAETWKWEVVVESMKI